MIFFHPETPNQELRNGAKATMMKHPFDFNSAKCMLCGNVGLDFVNNLRDDKIHWAAKCKTCGHIQLTPLPTKEEENCYYQTNELYSISRMDEERLVLKLAQLVGFQIEIMKNYCPSGCKLIEIGSGYGLFLDRARDEGYDVDGIEISKDKQLYCEHQFGIKPFDINLVSQGIPESLHGRYDAAVMFFLFEHIPNPVEFLRRAGDLLGKNGMVIILVPNVNEYMKQYCKEYNDFHYLRPHLSYFSADILFKVLSDSGFSNIEVYGKQQYSIENAIHWARNKAPFLAYNQIKMPEGLEFVNEYYKAKMESEMTSDMLVATGLWK
jgi:2-polyprenyl-3-methyl-5-hydroxy-6-metoxy-1,4-benzoquinol methylase